MPADSPINTTEHHRRAAGRMTVQKFDVGRASITYDAADQITTRAELDSAGALTATFDYGYDPAGNRTSLAELDGSRTTWSYDDTNQLTQQNRTGTGPYVHSLTYDAVGNRLVKNEDGSRTTSTYDIANQLQTATDATGTTNYTFDAAHENWTLHKTHFQHLNSLFLQRPGDLAGDNPVARF